MTVFIAFSQRSQNLLQALKGKITLEQLRQLYTGQVTNWQAIAGVDLPVKLYIPTSPSIIELFETKVLQQQQQVQTFRSLWQGNELTSPITQLPLLSMLQQILPESENDQIGSIGFGNLSRVYGQCSVYPLAIAVNGKRAIQPLVKNNMQPINPKLDLCKDKGSYQIDHQLLQHQIYPLTSPLEVIYPRDNSLPPVGRKFAEILQTEEGQQLLTKTGLIPLDD